MKNKTIIITGMHRSGTSMLTRLLNISGLYLGEAHEMLKAAKGNEKGHWENINFLKINDEILTLLGGSYYKPVYFPDNWESIEDFIHLKNKALDLVSDMNSRNPIWGVKDPRFCLTMPFWDKIIQNKCFIISVRNYFNIAESLNLRDNINISAGLNLWTKYFLNLAKNTENQNRIFTGYDSILDNWEVELSRLIEFIDHRDINFANSSRKSEINKFLDFNLRHHLNKNQISLEKNYKCINSQTDLLNCLSDDINNINIFLDLEITNKNSEIEKLNNSIQTQSQKIVNEFSEIEIIRKDLNFYKNEIENLKINYDNLKRENCSLKSVNDKLLKNNILITNENIQLKDENNDFKNSISGRLVLKLRKTLDFLFNTRFTNSLYCKLIDKIKKNINFIY